MHFSVITSVFLKFAGDYIRENEDGKDTVKGHPSRGLRIACTRAEHGLELNTASSGALPQWEQCLELRQ